MQQYHATARRTAYMKRKKTKNHMVNMKINKRKIQNFECFIVLAVWCSVARPCTGGFGWVGLNPPTFFQGHSWGVCISDENFFARGGVLPRFISSFCALLLHWSSIRVNNIGFHFERSYLTDRRIMFYVYINVYNVVTWPSEWERYWANRNEIIKAYFHYGCAALR